MKNIYKILSLVLFPTYLFADGLAKDWQLSFQEPASPLMEELINFHSVVFWIITVITIFVFLLLAYVCYKFSAKKNKVPSKTTHNSVLEVAWTLIPVLILVVIAIPSFRLLYKQNDFSNIDMTIKATGYTWYWGYEYPDHDDLTFDAIMLTDEELTEGQPRMLSTDNMLVLPVKKNIKVLITSDPSGVIHSWSVPSLGVKMDAIPGRLNETYFNINEPGMYYGMCSELCGPGHGFMPITIKAVTEEDFIAWVDVAKEEFANNKIENKSIALK
jgi:cytochrome c oxidase subunit 2|tara:strand:- start:151 stop:966 length:816 start_codon:yes stop_codon:yes gene_type:complete